MKHRMELLSSNHIIVVGMLDTMLVRDRNARRDKATGRPQMVEMVRKAGRTRGLGGRWENMTLQVGGPYGGMFALPLDLKPDVPGVELLDTAEAETMLAVEGRLQLKLTYDGRYATDRPDARNHTDRGRPTRALQLIVSRVREPNEQERHASSAVWLEGVVAEPPQVSRHPDLPAMQLGGTLLKITIARPLDFPGVEATIDEIAEVNVAIPTNHRDAEKLFRPGNRVRTIGQLDCRMEFQGGESVKSKLAEIDAEWAARKLELIGKPGELRRAEAIYRQTRQRFEAAPRLYVLLGNVEMLEGEPIALEETYQLRREFVRAQRAQRDERRRRVTADRVRRMDGAEMRLNVQDCDADLPLIAIDAVPDAASGATKPSRPRRRAEAIDLAEPNVLTMAADNGNAAETDEV